MSIDSAKMNKLSVETGPCLYPTRASMQSLHNMTCWPSKYAMQRDPIPEVARTCVEKLFTDIDADMDGRISHDELQAYARKSNLTFLSPEIVAQMFQEIANRRAIIHQEQVNNPITFDELLSCCIFYSRVIAKR